MELVLFVVEVFVGCLVVLVFFLGLLLDVFFVNDDFCI